jgi:hypothetical protein
VDRPRLLLVPALTELEWPIKPLLEEWAEVASFDAPGVGDELAPREFGPEAVAERGVEELDCRGWDRCVVVADEFGAMAAVRLMTARPEAATGFALGHACLENTVDGDRPTLNKEILAAMTQLYKGSWTTALRSYAQATQGAYGDVQVEEFLQRVPREVAGYLFASGLPPSEPLEERLRGLDIPMLFVKHQGCLGHTTEGYEDAIAAFPQARRAAVTAKPSTSPDFAKALRAFCAELEQIPASS